MFHKARLKLTLLYSIIFLVLFWSLSLGFYLWMNHYFGDEHGRNNYIQVDHKWLLFSNNKSHIEPVSDIIMDEFRNALLLIDTVLLLSVPAITWFLTGITLAPVQKAHDREKQFLTDASHDLRTPLSILSGEIEIALRKERTKEEYKKIMQSNKEEIDDLIALVQNMLFLVQNKQYQNVKKEQVDITDLLIERISVFRESAKQKKLQLSFVPSKQSLLIYGNTQLLKRLFTGILDNAVKYTLPGGKIITELKQEKQSVLVNITDTGIGIPFEEQEKVFDRFYRTDASRTEKGYGLGLSIAKQIVENHAGTIRLYSKAGKGTTIALVFPIATQNREKNLS
ncbi:MAG: HAMP domain-containing histidine kinase [Patescibacteria group bacterium]|nr:HAMP domain-containing histidine kinase [Patescibacteria group bacterium]